MNDDECCWHVLEPKHYGSKDVKWCCIHDEVWHMVWTIMRGPLPTKAKR